MSKQYLRSHVPLASGWQFRLSTQPIIGREPAKKSKTTTSLFIMDCPLPLFRALITKIWLLQSWELNLPKESLQFRDSKQAGLFCPQNSAPPPSCVRDTVSPTLITSPPSILLMMKIYSGQSGIFSGLNLFPGQFFTIHDATVQPIQ